MYTPAHFAEADRSRLHDFIEQHSFGLLVSPVGGLPFATHLPFLLDRASGPHGALVGHVAQGNPQWRELGGQTVLVVFSGPHAYVSPSWYEAEQVVPTWNYTAVHAYGRAQVVEDEGGLLEILNESVRYHEQALPRPWSFAGDLTFVKRLLGGIVGLRIEVEKLEGKFKLSQNHPAERRRKVVKGLEQRGGEGDRAVADLMRRSLPAEG